MGGSAGVGVLLLAAIPSTALAVTSLVILALFTAVSMTMVTTGFGATLASRQGALAAAAAGVRHRQPRLRLLVRRRGVEPDAVSVLGDRFGGVDPVCVADFERLAEERLEPGAFGYYAGGAGDELALTGNVEAWRALKLRPRVLVDVADVTTATTVLGTPVSMPLLVAPTAIQRLAHPDGEPGMARAAAAAGTIMCLSTLATATPAEVAAAAPDAPRWFQLYVFRDRGVTRSFVEQAVEHGYGAIVLTVDAPWLGRRERDLRTGFRVPEEIVVPSLAAVGEWEGATPLELLGAIDPSLTWDDLAELRSLAPLPLVLKGIQTAEDAAARGRARRRRDRRLEPRRPPARRASRRPRCCCPRSSRRSPAGSRSTSTAASAAAPTWSRRSRSARGRSSPAARRSGGSPATGRPGARRVLELLRDEIELALALCGCASPDAVSATHLTRIVGP